VVSLKLAEFENPITGKRGSLFDLAELWRLVLGVFVLLFVIAMGQNVARAVSSRVKVIDTNIEPIINSPKIVQSDIVL